MGFNKRGIGHTIALAMAENGWGRIINMASIMGVLARPTIPSYVSSKHGLLGLTKALAVEMGPMGWLI